MTAAKQTEKQKKTKNGNENNVSSLIWRFARSAAGNTLRRVCGLVLVVGLMSAMTPAHSSVACIGGKRDVDVMQANLYVGGDLTRAVVLDPTDPDYFSKLIQAVTGIYYEINLSQPPVRLQGVADEIIMRRPDLVSVEEASLLRIQSPSDLVLGGSSPATNVVFDYLQILVDKLNAQGAHYAVAAVTSGMDVEMPMVNMQTGAFEDVRLTDREAILVRTDLPPGQLRIHNPQGGNFQNVVVTGAGLPLLYGWCSVDVSIRGRDFRYICVHLTEETAPQIQTMQAQELLSGPANVKQPVMIVGDFNSDPFNRDGSGALAYNTIVSRGFGDAWAVLHPKCPAGGLTWGHDEFLADPTVAFGRRIDLIFFRGKMFAPADAGVHDVWLNRTQPPLWGSDHAVLTTGFSLR